MRRHQHTDGDSGCQVTGSRSRRRRLTATAVAIVCVGALLAPAWPAAAADPVVHVGTTAFWPDTTQTLVATGLTPDTLESIAIDGVAFASGTSDLGGTLQATVHIPWDVAEGPGTVSVTDPVAGTGTAAVTILTSWPMFRREPTHQANDVLDTGISETACCGSVQNLHSLWTTALGARVTGSPVVAGGKVYVGAQDGHFYALDAQSGHVLWTFTAGGGVYDTAAVVDGVAYVGGGSALYALDADTGTQLWRFATSGRLVSSPVVTGGAVYVGSDDHHVYAVDAATGSQLWSASTGGPVESSPALRAGRVVVGSQDQYVYAFDSVTGVRDWRRHTGGQVQSSPAISGSWVYVGSDDGKMYALNSATGVVRWTFQTKVVGFAFTDDHLNASPALVDGQVVFQVEHEQSGASSWSFFALDATTGARVVFTGLGASMKATHTQPFTPSAAGVNGLACELWTWWESVLCDTPQDFGGHEGAGAVVTSRNMVSSPAVAGEMVFAADVGGTVYASGV